MNKVEEIADEARASLSEYCMNECNSYCCRKGYLILRESEVELLIGDKKEQLTEEGTLKELFCSGKSSFNFSNSYDGCTQLENGKCKIHKHKDRPKVCHEFPIFVAGKKVRVSPRCYGAKAGLLYPFIRQFEELGCDIEGI